MKVNLLYYNFVGNTYTSGVCVVRYGSHGYTHVTLEDRPPSDTTAVGLTGLTRDSGSGNPTQSVTFEMTK